MPVPKKDHCSMIWQLEGTQYLQGHAIETVTELWGKTNAGETN